jgi:hypothetical protein
MISTTRWLLHGMNKIYLSRNRHSDNSRIEKDLQSEPSQEETFNQQPANLQTEVRRVFCTNTINIRIKD